MCEEVETTLLRSKIPNTMGSVEEKVRFKGIGEFQFRLG